MEKQSQKQRYKKMLQSFLKRSSLFIVSALIVLASTVVLYVSIYISRSADTDTLETIPMAVQDTEELVVPSETEGKRSQIHADSGYSWVYNKEKFLDPLPSYTLEQETWEGAEDTLAYVTEEHITMQEAGEIAVNVAHYWFAANIENAIVRVHFSVDELEPVQQSGQEWVISLYSPDWSTRVFVALDAVSGRVQQAEITREQKKYFVEDRTEQEPLFEYLEQPAYLSEEDFPQAVKGCTKLLKKFLEDNIAQFDSVKRIKADNLYLDSYDEPEGGNAIYFTVYFNDGTACNIKYNAWAGGERALKSFVEIGQ